MFVVYLLVMLQVMVLVPENFEVCRDCVGLDTDEESNALSKGGDMWIGKGVKGEHWDQNFRTVCM